jgi:lipopolysaccharide transport system ATP-binding protein
MKDVAIVVDGLAKQYKLGQRQTSYGTLREAIVGIAKSPLSRISNLIKGNGSQGTAEDGWIWALKDVSFKVQRGEVVGIIGRNGAGKSTLLKILSQITPPTEGGADIRGRVGSLLEVGTGFHPELTGRENTYLNGAILGMQKREIERKFDEIVAFAEVDRFIDTPVKHYSSGMYLRLAFAVAAHLDPEILIVDEVLAVGDAMFQNKCLGKMRDVAKGGRTVLFVSHNTGAIAQLCERVLWFEKGRLKLSGSPHEVVSQYLASGGVTKAKTQSSMIGSRGSAFLFETAVVLSDERSETQVVRFDAHFYLEMSYEITYPMRDFSLISQLTDTVGNIMWTSWDSDNSDWKGGYTKDIGRYVSTCKVPSSLLKPGRYYVSIGARCSERPFDMHENVLMFDVSDVGYRLNGSRVGVITPILNWEISRK